METAFALVWPMNLSSRFEEATVIFFAGGWQAGGVRVNKQKILET